MDSCWLLCCVELHHNSQCFLSWRFLELSHDIFGNTAKNIEEFVIFFIVFDISINGSKCCKFSRALGDVIELLFAAIIVWLQISTISTANSRNSTFSNIAKNEKLPLKRHQSCGHQSSGGFILSFKVFFERYAEKKQFFFFVYTFISFFLSD